MTNYRMIAVSVSDYPSDITFAEIEALDENDRDYFLVHESNNLDEIRAEACSFCADSVAGAVSSLDEEDEREEDYWKNHLWALIHNVLQITTMGAGQTIENISCAGDWVRIEQAK